MPEVPLNFGIGSAPGETPDEGGPIFTNAYAELPGGTGKSPVIIRATEGRKPWAGSVGAGPCRALLEHNGTLTGVIGRNVVTYDTNGSLTILGGLTTDGPATMAANRKTGGGQIGVVSGGLYKIIESGVMTDVVDPDLPPPIDISFVDGFFIFTIADGRLFSSEIDEGTNINALHFTSAEGAPDQNVRGIVRGREFICLGKRSMEFYRNDGGSDFPLVPVQGTFSAVGCSSAASAVVVVANGAEVLVWQDDNNIVRAAGGYQGERISTHAVERSIEAESSPENVTAWTYTRAGHVFYVLSGSNFTWVYDFTTNQWHNRESAGSTRWNGEQHARVGKTHIVGDHLTGALYELDPDTHTDAGEYLRWKIRAPITHQYPHRLRVNEIRLDVLAGRGLNSTDPHISNPEIMLRMSKDGGNTWGNQRHVPMGKVGEYSRTVRSRRWGATGEDGFVLEASASSAVSRGLLAQGSMTVDRLAA